MRRTFSALLIAAGVMALAVTPATAEGQHMTRDLTLSGVGYTDIREPSKTLTGKDMPVGAWLDEQQGYHVSKAYFTIDLKPLRGVRLFNVYAYAYESAVTDCTKPRTTELWHTKLTEQPTWLRAPRELTRQEGTAGTGCRTNLRWDLTDTAAKEIAAGAEKATFALRLPVDTYTNVEHGRRIAGLQVEARYNTAPSAATDPQTNGKPCDGTDHFVGKAPALFAKVTDADPVPGFQIRYVVTDVADPAKRHEGVVSSFTGSPYTYLPDSFLEHGHTYSWTAQGEDGFDKGEASPPCRFTADLVAPANAPTIASKNFTPNGPTTGVGMPGEFTFDANGDEDVVGFRYRLRDDAMHEVAADRPGGKATATVRVPISGDNRIEAYAVDRVGHGSPFSTYAFKVRYNGPSVHAPEEAQLGSTIEVSMSSAEPNITEFVYQATSNGPELTVPAVSGAAKVSVRVTSAHSTSVRVWAKTAAGDRTASSGSFTRTADSTPTITRDGDLYTFAPGMPGVVEYVYSVNSGPDQVIAAGPDGRVTLPLDLGDVEFPPPSVEVRSRTADGLVSRMATYYKES
ncbi:hypothetical protein [Lentzea sp. NPDC051838]|uniref:hypothetical protein n=1 Tax=Lentzea sp. NPDC051838 TaxID=3154849 RepID=UPI003431ED4A